MGSLVISNTGDKTISFVCSLFETSNASLISGRVTVFCLSIYGLGYNGGKLQEYERIVIP